MTVEGVEEEAVFLGERDVDHVRQTTTGKVEIVPIPILYFFHPDSGFILNVPRREADIQPEISLALNENNSRIQKLRIRCQRGESCAGYSTFNTLEFTKELGFLLDALRKKDDYYDPIGWLKEIDKSEMNFVHRSRFRNIFGSRFELPRQVRYQMDFLKEKGLSAEITTRMSKIEKHLDQGLPVILNLWVKWGPSPLHVNISPVQGISKPRDSGSLFVPDPKKSPQGGGHSVMAIGMLRDRLQRKKILIADSARANFAIWDYQEVSQALWEGLLVGPAP